MDFSLHEPQAPPSPPPLPPQQVIPLTLLMEKVGDSETHEAPLEYQYPMLSLLEGGGGEDVEDSTSESSCTGTCSHECLKEKYYGERDIDGEAEDDDDSLRGWSPEFGTMSSEWFKKREEEEEGIRVLVDSREEDRLFWEACLANRYPYD
ncbi:hypothetical protein J5N97_013158 [Dioscorea zingiberensis]|uniref:Uncharacterized protein n=1 Tax=Dioscorea zingiberensis TaxID=325984 RepID=A0A9D5CRP6_9LILI|nr:hypothetical protein J5N97_013158 [Dioscorea zingiberensis]